jgi:hypothetical protein
MRKEQKRAAKTHLVRAQNNGHLTFQRRLLQEKEPLVHYGDSIYLKGDWDGAPIVLEKFKLIFFASAKFACTTWKQLFRRMMDLPDWNTEEYTNLLPWNPELNGLKDMYDYDQKTASEMMTSPNWTRAIFVRDPKDRFLSAYLDKAVNNPTYMQTKCCYYTGKCAKAAKASLN